MMPPVSGAGPDDGGLQSRVKRPSPERPATTGTRRKRSWLGKDRCGEFRRHVACRTPKAALGDADEPLQIVEQV